MRNNHIHFQHFGISKLLVPYDSSSMASSSNLPEIFCMAFRLDRSAAEWDLRSGVAAIQSWNSISVLLIVVREPLSKRSVRTSISLPEREEYLCSGSERLDLQMSRSNPKLCVG